MENNGFIHRQVLNMKISSGFLAVLICIMLNACGNANQINGKTMKTAHKSVAFIKEHLPAN
jgi:hypothetical protein